MPSSRLALSALAVSLVLSAAIYAAAPAPATPPAPAGTPPTPAAPAPRGGFGGGGGGGFRGGGFGGGGRGADQPVIQAGDNSRIAHEQLLTKAKLGQGKIDLYFEGDSIMRRWGSADPDPKYKGYLKNFNDNFFGWNAADFGWGADLVQNILWRLQNGELDDVNPKVVVFLGGTNNLQPGGNDNNVADITKGLTACFDTIHKKAPDATLIVLGILPRQANYQATIDKVNANIAKMADGKKTRYIDLKDKFLDPNGKLIPGMLNSDSLHPDTKGYQTIADTLKPVLTELLGPPAKEDHAPPPTGDPKVAPNYPPK